MEKASRLVSRGGKPVFSSVESINDVNAATF